MNILSKLKALFLVTILGLASSASALANAVDPMTGANAAIATMTTNAGTIGAGLLAIVVAGLVFRWIRSALSR